MHDDPWGRREPPRQARAGDREDDFGQEDYSVDYGYAPETQRSYRRGPSDGYAARHDADRRQLDADEARREPRSWFGLRRDPEPHDRHDRRRLASDRRIFAVIAERMEHDRRVDTSDVEIAVEDGVVYLSGSSRTREGKRRIEHMSEVDGVRDIVNSIRVRELGR